MDSPLFPEVMDLSFGQVRASTSATRALKLVNPGPTDLTVGASEAPTSVRLDGRGVVPILAAQPESLSFGSLAIGARRGLQLAFVNQGATPLRVTGVSIYPGGFFQQFSDAYPYDIPPGGKFIGSVIFQPSYSGSFAATINLALENPNIQTLKVPLNGTAVPMPLSADLNPTDGDQRLMWARISRGEEVTLQLFSLVANSIRGFNLRIDFDSTQVQLVPGSFVPGPLVPGITPLTLERPGYVEVGGARLMDGRSTGPGMMGSVKFRTLPRFQNTSLEILSVTWNFGPGVRETVQTNISMGLASLEPLGDFNRDRRVDLEDFLLFAAAFGSREAWYDLDGEGTVGFSDFFLFAQEFGKSSL